MKKILVLLVGMLLLLSNKAFAMEPYINIISPDGGENFNVGDKITVKWESGNIPTSDDFCIRLNHPESGFGINLTGSIKDDGLENVYITQGIMEKFKENFNANNFPIDKINGEYNLDVHYPCYSGNQFYLNYNGDEHFSIGVYSKPFTVTYPEITTPSIEVLSPNGSESYTAGSEINIKWKTENISSDSVVSLSLDSIQDSSIGFILSKNGQQIFPASKGMATVMLPSSDDIEKFKTLNYGKYFKIGMSLTDRSVYPYKYFSDKSDRPFTVKKIDQSILPSTFTMKITSDMTSPGASRDYSARLAFVNDLLVSGTETYKIGEGGVCKENCNRQTTCVIKNGAWVDSSTGGICSISNFIPLTKTELESKIVDKKILNKKDCGHNDICYELVGNETSTISTTKINRTLKRGLRGDDVKRLQEFLGLNADGIFGYGTANAVKKWQSQNGLTSDGLFGSYSRVKAGLNN